MTDPFNSLWIERYRPKTLSDIVLSKEDREFFESLAKKQEIPHLLFAGNPGVGKTSSVLILVNDVLKCEYLLINASDELGVEAIRTKVTGFARTKSFDGKTKVVIIDEADSISFEGMKILRTVMEEYAATTRFILTCNYLNKIIPAIKSRCQVINLNPPLDKTVERVVEILKKENITIPAEQKPLLLQHIKQNLPDLRRIIGNIQKFSSSGTLQIKTDSSSDFAKKLFNKLLRKADLINLRREVIENEKAFSNDYGNLLKQMFEAIYSSELPQDKKIDCLMIVSKSMEASVFSIDKEISFFGTLVNLSKIV